MHKTLARRQAEGASSSILPTGWSHELSNGNQKAIELAGLLCIAPVKASRAKTVS